MMRSGAMQLSVWIRWYRKKNDSWKIDVGSVLERLFREDFDTTWNDIFAFRMEKIQLAVARKSRPKMCFMAMATSIF